MVMNQRRLRLIALLTAMLPLLISCASSSSSPKDRFCDGAIALLRRTATDLPSDGGDVVEHLRAVPQLGLSSDQAQRYVAAVDQLDTAIHAFVGGLPSGSDGWSTVPVTAVVTDVCGRQAPGVSIVP